MSRPSLSRPWTPEEEERLLALFREGTHPQIIAAKLKRTVIAVNNRRRLLTIPEALPRGSGDAPR